MTAQTSIRSAAGISVIVRICQLYVNPRTKLRWAILLASAFALVVIVAMNVELHESHGWKRVASGIRHQNRSLNADVHDGGPAGKCQCQTAQTALPPALPSTEFYINVLNSMSRRRNDSFDPQINATELTIMLDLLWAFLDLCEQHGIQVMLYGGTLLGSYRHHGFMPWDDDVDLMLKESDQERLETVIMEKSADMALTKAGRWKVWNKTACLHKPYNWCWPYLDLSFYRLAGDLLFDTETAYGWNYSYPVRLTFPLHKRPFMGRWVDSPRDALRFLGYDKTPSDLCISLYYSHKHEGSPESPVLTSSCASLSVTYPFVVRVPAATVAGTGVLEVLRFYGGWPVYTVPVDEPSGAFNFEYSIVPVQ